MVGFFSSFETLRFLLHGISCTLFEGDLYLETGFEVVFFYSNFYYGKTGAICYTFSSQKRDIGNSSEILIGFF